MVDEVEQGALTYKEAQDKYGIQGRSTVLTWLRKHGRLDWDRLLPSTMEKEWPMDERPKAMTPEQKIKALKVELFEEMLEVIRTEYGVKLPKKPSHVIQAKQISRADGPLGLPVHGHQPASLLPERARSARITADRDAQAASPVTRRTGRARRSG